MPDRRPIEYILKQYPRLEELTWELHSLYDFRWSPSNVNAALLPLHSVLVKLEMSMTIERGYVFDNGGNGQMDFSNFTSLKFVKVHDRIIFARRPWNDDLPDRYRYCHKILPASLVEFEVITPITVKSYIS
jgi:hypothetical protein